MTAKTLPIGATALLLGLAIALLGSFADDLLGGSALVAVLQIVLWLSGGTLMLAGAAATVTSRAGQHGARRARTLRASTR